METDFVGRSMERRGFSLRGSSNGLFARLRESEDGFLRPIVGDGRKLSHVFQTIGWVITVVVWALIRRLHLTEGESMRSIEARLGISRNTVATGLSADGPPNVRAWATELRDQGHGTGHPGPAEGEPADAGNRVGWSGSPAWFREKVARIRPEYAPADPADRISYEPGDLAQCDLWFPDVRVPVGAGKPSVLPVLMVSSHSRFIMARMIPSRMTGDLLAGM